jgi:hypothetical protein
VPVFSRDFFGLYEQMVRNTGQENMTQNERKGFGGKKVWPIAEIYQFFFEETGEKHKKTC